MRKLLKGGAILAALGAAGFFILTIPTTLSDPLPTHEPDLDNGRLMFVALLLTGGHELKTEFGTFVAPNISPDPQTGIGGWTDEDFINAMQYGVGPDGQHLYPAFPYTSYARVAVPDLLDLHAYLQTLPATDNAPGPNALSFPFTIRRGLGLWKHLNLDPAPVAPVSDDPVVARGQYLVEGPGHCSECHTPRNALGGLQKAAWMSGGPNPDGPGTIPNITPHDDGIASWSEGDIAYYLESGFTPDFDSAGGTMVAVIRNTSQLPAEDREAIAKYLKSLPALPGG